jgi:hypothetical protein
VAGTVARLFAVGHESRVPIERDTNHVWTVRDGRATSLSVYRERSEALEAAGLDVLDSPEARSD